MQDKLRELLRDSRIEVGCVEEVKLVERALFSVGGYWSPSVGGYWGSRDACYISVEETAGYLVVDSILEMHLKNKLSVSDTKLYKRVTVGEIKNLTDFTEQVSEKEYKTEISLGSGVVLRTNGKVIYEGGGVIVVE